MKIRPQQITAQQTLQTNDAEQIQYVNNQAFPTSAEAKLITALSKADVDLISLVAEENEQIIGHILFSPASIEHSNLKVAGLAPMAVLPEWQGKGVGTKLVTEGIKACKKAGYQAVIVLGHPSYYPRFGFEAAIHFNIQSEYEVPTEAFMILELEKACLEKFATRVTAKYHPLFNSL